MTESSPDDKLDAKKCENDYEANSAANARRFQHPLLMLNAHVAVHAPLVGTGPALSLCCVISAHEALAAEVCAAHVNGALVDAQVGALRVIAHTLATLDTIEGARLTDLIPIIGGEMLRSDLISVDKHHLIVVLRRHIDGHTDGHILVVVPIWFDRI